MFCVLTLCQIKIMFLFILIPAEIISITACQPQFEWGGAQSTPGKLGWAQCNLLFLHCFAFYVFAKSCIFCIFFLHFDATLPKAQVNHMVGSCIFEAFSCQRQRRSRLLFKKKFNTRIYDGISLEVASSFALFLHFF